MSFIAGVGKTNIDLIFESVPHLPKEGEEIYSAGFSVQLGGGVPATLLNLSRLGLPVKLATSWGTDLFSAFAADAFEKSGIKPTNFYQGEGFPVNVTAVAVTEKDRTFLSYGPDVSPSEDSKTRFYEMAKDARVVLMQRGYLDVYRALKARGTILVFDTGWDDHMTLEGYYPYLELADYYTPNQREALKITGKTTPEAAAMVLGGMFERVLVKLDKAGCLGMEKGKQFMVEPLSEFDSLDSTGAGDAFLAGFVYGLYYGKPFRECILYGNLTGGKCVTQIGCLTAFLTEPELLRMAEENQALIATE